MSGADPARARSGSPAGASGAAGAAPDLHSLSVLVVDDEADIRLGLRKLVGGLGAATREAASGAEALEQFEHVPADLVITDLMMPGMTGVELLEEVKRRRPETAVVVLTGYGTVQTAVQCLQSGAAHFLTKPFDNAEVLGIVRRLGAQVLARRFARDGRRAAHGAPEIVARDQRMRRVLELVERVAPSPAAVLVEGESGTGKDLVARAVHALSAVADRPFQAVNCAALPDTLLESELFGHRRGAFTGADRDRRGLFEEAAGGTVFLDEVSSMSPGFQGKLLRVLQEKRVRPVGASEEREVAFRLVAATNRDLEALVRDGSFREDLYYRLAVVRVHLPPLRERPGDVEPLARHVLVRAAAECLGPEVEAPVLGEEALAALAAHDWPGNVRELENAVARAVIVCGEGRIQPHHLGLQTSPWSAARAGARPDPGGSGGSGPSDAIDGDTPYADAKRRVLEAFQREFVERALERTAGNVSRAAEACGMTRVALQKIMRQLGIDRARFDRDAAGGG